MFARHERLVLIRSAAAKVLSVPLVALAGLANTAIVLQQTGPSAFGLVQLVATVSLLFPFADLGLGITVTTAVASGMTSGDHRVLARTVRAVLGRLALIAAVVVLLAAALGIAGAWGTVLGQAIPTDQGVFISLAVALFGLSIPLTLGTRILIGLGRNDVVVLLSTSASALTLLSSLALSALGAAPFAYSLTTIIGVLVANTLSLLIAIRLCHTRGITLFQRAGGRTRGLLAGSGAMLLITIALPVALQWNRVLLGHLAPAIELTRYAIVAQIYAVGWSVLSTAAAALWPMFVARRGSEAATLSLWRSSLLWFVLAGLAGAIVLVTLGPLATIFISGGTVQVGWEVFALFGVLLIGQATHLPTGMMLTMPSELRWQAKCHVLFAVVAVGATIFAIPPLGVAGAVLPAALALLALIVLPDLVHGRSLVARRPNVPADAAVVPA